MGIEATRYLVRAGSVSIPNSRIRSLPVRSATLVYVTFFRFYSLWRMHILVLQSGLFPSTCFGQISAKAIAPETFHPLAASRACEGIPLVIAQEAAVCSNSPLASVGACVPYEIAFCVGLQASIGI